MTWETVETGGTPWVKLLVVPGGWLYVVDHDTVFVPTPSMDAWLKKEV